MALRAKRLALLCCSSLERNATLLAPSLLQSSPSLRHPGPRIATALVTLTRDAAFCGVELGVAASVAPRAAGTTLPALLRAADACALVAPTDAFSPLCVLASHFWPGLGGAWAASPASLDDAAACAALRLLVVPSVWRLLPGVAPAGAADAAASVVARRLLLRQHSADGAAPALRAALAAACGAAAPPPSLVLPLLGNLLGAASYGGCSSAVASFVGDCLASLPRGALACADAARGPAQPDTVAADGGGGGGGGEWRGAHAGDEAGADATAMDVDDGSAALPPLPPSLPPPHAAGSPPAAPSSPRLPPAVAAQLRLLSSPAVVSWLIRTDGAAVDARGGAPPLLAALRAAPPRVRALILATSAFGHGCIDSLWAGAEAEAASPPPAAPAPSAPASHARASHQTLLIAPPPRLVLFSTVYSYFLLTCDDASFAGGAASGGGLSQRQHASLVRLLRDALAAALWGPHAPTSGPTHPDVSDLARLQAELHARCFGRSSPFCNASDFNAPQLATLEGEGRALADALAGRAGGGDDGDSDDEGGGSGGGGGGGGTGAPSADAAAASSASQRRSSRAARLLATAPSLAPFRLRARLFAELAAAASGRAAASAAHGSLFGRFAGRSGWDGGGGGGGGGVTQVTIRRAHEAEDGFSQLASLPPETLRGPVRVRFVSTHGETEAGVDGGGLWKDYLDAFWGDAFRPGRGLWRPTPGNTLFPDSGAQATTPSSLAQFRFQGAMLAKAMCEGTLAELPLALPMLAKLRGAGGGSATLSDLASLDEGLHGSLVALRRFSGDHSSLCLFFTAPGAPDVELVPGGKDIAVTAANKAAFIASVALWALSTSVAPQAASFCDGFFSLVSPSWTRMFSAAELGVLVSGASGAVLDVDDLASHAVFSGGYSASHPSVQLLWDVLRSLAPPHQAAALRFVTACSRPPLLGFATLDPPFCVHRAAVAGSDAGDHTADLQRLPTASTCVNTLKLPPYATEEQLRAKLLMAITSGSGFDLS